jgi:hypothetical protein
LNQQTFNADNGDLNPTYHFSTSKFTPEQQQTFNADNGIGTFNQTTNCIIPWDDSWNRPNLNPTYHFYTSTFTPEENYPFKFRKVDNGLILMANGKELIFKTIKEMFVYLEKEFK